MLSNHTNKSFGSGADAAIPRSIDQRKLKKMLALERWENEGGFTVEVDVTTADRIKRLALERWENEGGACNHV